MARIWERHLVNCAAIREAIPYGATVCDVGSGGGLPGIVVGLLRPDVRLVLLEPRHGRVLFLREAVTLLELERVDVVQARAERHRELYDVVLARAVARIDRLADLTLTLCRSDGFVLALKGDRAEEEVAAAGEGLRGRVGSVSIERWGGGVIDPPTTVVRMTPAESESSGAGRDVGASGVERRGAEAPVRRRSGQGAGADPAGRSGGRRHRRDQDPRRKRG